MRATVARSSTSGKPAITCRCLTRTSPTSAANRRSYRANHPAALASTKARKSAGRARNAAYVRSIKSETPCADCGQVFPPICMDFDHVRGAKVADICGLVLAPSSLQRIMDEIAKCELVCANCHRIRTELGRKVSNLRLPA